MSVPLFASPLSYAGTPTAGVNEVQRITITGSPTGGSIACTLDGQTTTSVAYNSTAAQVQTLLEALSNVAVGDVACTGGPLPGTAVDVTFQNNLGGKNISAMTASSSLTGGSSPAVAITTVTAGVKGTFRGARYGQTLQDTTNGVLYEQTSTSPFTPTWSEVEP